MVKHTQRICQQELTNSLSVFDHFVGLALKEFIQFFTFLWLTLNILLMIDLVIEIVIRNPQVLFKCCKLKKVSSP